VRVSWGETVVGSPRIQDTCECHRVAAAEENLISTERASETTIVRTSMTRRNGIIETTDVYRYAIVSEDGNPRLHSIVLTTESGERFETLNAGSTGP
jgi:hypothetical protein